MFNWMCNTWLLKMQWNTVDHTQKETPTLLSQVSPLPYIFKPYSSKSTFTCMSHWPYLLNESHPFFKVSLHASLFPFPFIFCLDYAISILPVILCSIPSSFRHSKYSIHFENLTYSFLSLPLFFLTGTRLRACVLKWSVSILIDYDRSNHNN